MHQRGKQAFDAQKRSSGTHWSDLFRTVRKFHVVTFVGEIAHVGTANLLSSGEENGVFSQSEEKGASPCEEQPMAVLVSWLWIDWTKDWTSDMQPQGPRGPSPRAPYLDDPNLNLHNSVSNGL